jgi:cardiolipin synthase
MTEFAEQRDLRLPAAHQPLMRLFQNQNMALPFKDNTVEIFTDGYAFFPALMREISKAEDHIHIDIFIFNDDELGRLIADALIDKARQGVEVRVIYDDVEIGRASCRERVY